MCELAGEVSPFELEQRLEEWMIFGSYPGQLGLVAHSDKAEYLENLTRAYLYKDVFELTNIRFSRKLQDLVKLLAFQIGSEVSLNELANKLTG